MEKWVAIRHGTAPWTPKEVRPISRNQRLWLWLGIAVWLVLVALLLVLVGINDVEAAEVSFSKTIPLIEVDMNVQLAFLSADDQAKQTAIASNCDLAKMRRKMVVFDFTEPQLPVLRITYTCVTKGEAETSK